MIGRRELICGTFLLLVTLVAGCNLPGKPDPANRPVPADQVEDFHTLYTTHCAGCHGADGRLGPAPPLNDPIFLAIVPEADLVQVITGGRAVTVTQATPMPAFSRSDGGPLTTAQVEVLAAGIKEHWKPRAETRPLPAYRTSANGGNRDQGLRVFARACAGCHGSNGQGADQGAINEPAFLALISDQALRRLVITGRPDLGMPAYDETIGRSPEFQPLTNEDINDLVALLASWRQTSPAESQ
jgi:mono/diheme cytochrome c family protein